MKQSEKTRLLVLTALFAAMIFVVTRINIPLGFNNRIIHVGDAVIYLAACILPAPYAMASGAIGAGLADFMTPGCMVWILPTMIIKPLLAVWFTSGRTKFICKRNVLAIVFAGLTGLIGYAIAEGIIYGNFLVALAGIPADSIQSIGSAAVFLAIGFGFDKMNIKVQLNRQLRGDL